MDKEEVEDPLLDKKDQDLRMDKEEVEDPLEDK